jgi:hypothetical protein
MYILHYYYIITTYSTYYSVLQCSGLGIKQTATFATYHRHCASMWRKLWHKKVKTPSDLFVILSSDRRQLRRPVLPDVLQVLDLGVVVITDAVHLRGAVVADPVGLKINLIVSEGLKSVYIIGVYIYICMGHHVYIFVPGLMVRGLSHRPNHSVGHGTTTCGGH